MPPRNTWRLCVFTVLPHIIDFPSPLSGKPPAGPLARCRPPCHSFKAGNRQRCIPEGPPAPNGVITASNAFKCVALTGFLLRVSVNLKHGRPISGHAWLKSADGKVARPPGWLGARMAAIRPCSLSSSPDRTVEKSI